MKLWQKSVSMTALLASVACGNELSSQAVPAPLAADKQIVEQALSDGTFTITIGPNSSMCLDVANGSNADGATVQIAHCNGGDAQKWQHKGAQWRIFGDKCLNVTDGRNDNGTHLQIWSCGDGDDNAKWTVKGNSLEWKNRNRCLDVTDGRIADGTPVQIWDCDGNNKNQAWDFKATQAGGANQSNNSQAPMSGTAGLGTTPSGMEVSPYFWTWAKWSNDYAITTLVDARAKAGMEGATIAFGLSGGGCNLSGDINDMADDIRSYISQGGRIILSFGGAAGIYPWISCSDATALANALDGQMKSVGTHALDFDIEGQNLNTMQHTNVLLDALKILQGRYNDVYVSFTLPVDDNSGVPSSGLDVIRGAKNKGVNVSRVNIMTMDFGHGPKSGQDMGDQCINAAQATFNQLKAIYPGVADSAIWHMIGITPMIGENDDHFKFTIPDAQKVANFAKQKGIGLLSFWGMQRDRSGTGNLDNFSNVAQSDFQFLNIFNHAR